MIRAARSASLARVGIFAAGALGSIGPKAQPARDALRTAARDPALRSEAEWALRSYQDKPDATRWGGQNVYDIRSTSGGTALDGTKYSDW